MKKQAALILLSLVLISACGIRQTVSETQSNKTKPSPKPVVDKQFESLSCPAKTDYLDGLLLEAKKCQHDSQCSQNKRILICGVTPCSGMPVNNSADLSVIEPLASAFQQSCGVSTICACPPGAYSRCISGQCQDGEAGI